MFNRFWLMAMAVVLSCWSVEAFAQRPATGGTRGKPSFDQLLAAFDANRDGLLASTEVPKQLWPRLAVADSNKDGFVARAEYDSYKR